LLKCYNGVDSDNPSIIEGQTAMMDLLSRNGVQTSRTIKCTQTGEDIAWPELTMFDKSTKRCAARLCFWVDGKSLVGRATPSILVDAGALLGKVHQIFDAQAFDHPGLHRYHQWDQTNTGDLTAFTSSVLNEQRRRLVEGVIDRFKREVLSVQDGLRRSALQADFNDANIIVMESVRCARFSNEGVGVTCVGCCLTQYLALQGALGVIDYGDIVNGWLVSDVAIAAAYASVSSYGQAHPLAAAALMVHGFAREFPLTELEKQLLPLLATCRLVTSVVIGAFSYQQQPDCAYLLLHAQPAWASLEAFTADHIQDDLRELFLLACNPSSTTDAVLEMATKAQAKLV
jgi:Ser/Thr protein kinase RdoA (MazF antagonist)